MKDDVGWICPICKEWCNSRDIVCPFCATQIMQQEAKFFRMLKKHEEYMEGKQNEDSN